MDYSKAVARYVSMKKTLQFIALLNLYDSWYPQSQINVEKCYNYVIVGGGTAGCVLANRLSENPNVNVLLIEAGGNPPMESDIPSLVFYTRFSPIDWNFTVYNELTGEYDPMHHGKVLGGTSSINTMRFSRGSKHDYDSWGKEVKDVNWNWQNVLPYFKKSEKLVDETILHSSCRIFHGTEGYVEVNRTTDAISEKYMDAFCEVGNTKVLDVNNGVGVGFVIPLWMIANKHRQSSAYSYIRSQVVKERKNLDILKHAYATRIIFDDYKVATGVEIMLENGKKITVNAITEVIISAGSINTPKILMLSGIGPKEQLERLNITTISDLPIGKDGRQQISVLKTYKMKNTNEVHIADPFELPNPVFNGFVALNKSQPYADYVSFSKVIINDSQAVVDQCLSLFPNKEFVCVKLFEESKGVELLVNLIKFFDVKSRAKVELNSTDPLNPPTIRTNVYKNNNDMESDVKNFAKSMIDFARVKTSTLFKNTDAALVDYGVNECCEYDFEADDYLLCYIKSMMRTIYIFGTCPMGTVTDTRFRVKGVQKLRVVDSSTIPVVITADINPAVLMLAEKAADLIKEDYMLHIMRYIEDSLDYLRVIFKNIIESIQINIKNK